MPRVNTVKKCRKAQGNCGKCGDEIKIGDGYKFIKFRYAGKRKRCMKAECRFRPSDLTNSKMSQIYAAQESIEDQLAEIDHMEVSADDLKDMIGTMADAVTEVAEEYRESAENQRQYFQDSPTADESEEKADQLEEWANNLESQKEDIEDFDEDGARESIEEDLHQEAILALEEGEELPEDWEADPDDVCHRVDDRRSEWAADQIDKVEEYINDCPL